MQRHGLGRPDLLDENAHTRPIETGAAERRPNLGSHSRALDTLPARFNGFDSIDGQSHIVKACGSSVAILISPFEKL